MLSHEYNIIIDRDVGAPGYGIEVIYVLNANNKQFISMLMVTVKLTDAADYDSNMAMHTSTAKIDIILAS